MVDSFTALKKRKRTDLTELNDKIASLDSTFDNPEDDGTFWTVTTDKAGTGFAIVRFMPAPADHDMPFVRGWDHGFKGVNGWYIEESLTTLELPDPMTEYNAMLWSSNKQEQARKQKRRIKYYTNIFVISDPKNPDAEGKVFRFRFGAKIFEKLKRAMDPSEAERDMENKEGFDPFDFWSGANFKLKCTGIKRDRSYDECAFDDCTEFLDGDDDKLEAVWKKLHELNSFVDPENTKRFKPYDELKKKMCRVLGLVSQDIIDGNTKTSSVSGEKEPDALEEEAAPTFDADTGVEEKEDDSDSSDEDDADIDFFKNLAKGE